MSLPSVTDIVDTLPTSLEELCTQLCALAEVDRVFGIGRLSTSELLELIRRKAEHAQAAYDDEFLRVADAERFSGYSGTHLRTLADRGVIRRGGPGNALLRRGDLPKKAHSRTACISQSDAAQRPPNVAEVKVPPRAASPSLSVDERPASRTASTHHAVPLQTTANPLLFASARYAPRGQA